MQILKEGIITRIKGQKGGSQVIKQESIFDKDKTTYHGDTSNLLPIESMLPIPTPLENFVVGVAYGGGVGCFQEIPSLRKDRVSK